MIKAKFKKVLTNTLNLFGYTIVPKGLGYFNAKQIIETARRLNLSVPDYVEKYNIGGVGERKNRIIQEITQQVQRPLINIIEIGAGTGMYMEEIYKYYTPSSFEIYETNMGWVEYLKNFYGSMPGIKICNADGVSLKESSNNAVDAVFSHGVFVYLPILSTLRYLEECVRVIKKDGLIIFDCFLDDFFDYFVVKKWHNDHHQYDFPVVLPRRMLNGFLEKNFLEIVHEFNIPYHASESTYFILRKK